MKKWRDGEEAVLMYQSGRNGPFHGIALMTVHVKEKFYDPKYPKLSAQTTKDIYGKAFRAYRLELRDVDAYTYKDAVKAVFKYGVR